jgi:hypothetical protein
VSLVRQGRRRSGSLLRPDLPQQSCRGGAPRARGLPVGQGGGRAHRELHLPCVGLNGGPEFKPNEAFSFQVLTADQEETDRYWNAIVNNGGQESQCGWCKDKWGISWQITPKVLMDAFEAGGEKAKRAFEAMMPMQKIDVAKIEAAIRGRV